MAVELGWQLDSLVEYLNETLETIEKMDSAGLLAERVAEIRGDMEVMDLGRRHRNSLTYSTDDGTYYYIDGRSREVIKKMPERDKAFLAAILSIVASELAPGA